VTGDIKIVFYDQDRLDKDEKMFAFWFHTGFVRNKHLKLRKLQLDKAVKDKHNKHFDPDFSCEVSFSTLQELEYKEQAKPLATVGGAKKKKKKDFKHRIKGLVSKKKRRFQQDGFDLDLSYITDRIIAMGFPSSGREGFYRNNMSDVKRFMEKYHPKHFKVYNLCAEREYDPVAFTDMGGSFEYFPFQDHNPCALEMLPAFCQSAKDFLDADEKNVVAIHCKAGKGRTGLLSCCLLNYLGTSPTAKNALTYYANQRTHNKKGVTIPSQIRYVQYFDNWRGQYYEEKKAFQWDQADKIKCIGFRMNMPPNFDVGGGCDPYFKLQKPIPGKKGKWGADMDTFYNMKKARGKVPSYRKGALAVKDLDVELQGDVKFVFYDKDKLGKDDKMMVVWIHTSFLQSNELKLRKPEIDKACKDKKCENFPAEFELTLLFEGVPEKVSLRIISSFVLVLCTAMYIRPGVFRFISLRIKR
jgi:phosphatidylinositol-3,4,5-trisphosphate 3-phosphatase/dual-specificity protein phosphatase PTEN